ncbi:MAG: glycosyltransferase [Verrucomicrobia bacterium]|jgi:glycosyltransferase involved in cell wall biosynthesis|nr:glycosyltransferase [Verrucomicrobiota bacterium]
MKIIQILPELDAGGVERGTLEVSKYLVEQGHESIVISNGGRLVEQLQAEGSRHITLPVHKKRLSSLRQVKVLRQLFEAECPDILHLRSRLPAWLAWLAWRKIDPATRPRLITTVHGFYSVNAYSAIMMKGERVICVSNSVKDYVLQNYPKVPEEKLTVIHRGVDPAEFTHGYQPTPEWKQKWEEDYPQLKGKFVVTLPGRITQLKGHSDFIELFTQLDPHKFHGLIVGDAHPKRREYAQTLQEKVRESGLTEHITFTGHRSDLREIFAVSDAVLSLTTQPESFGRTTLEALALGCPVLGYQHGGVGEILREIFPQGLVETGNMGAIAEQLKRWAQGAPKPEKGHPFTLDAMLESTLATYHYLKDPTAL